MPWTMTSWEKYKYSILNPNVLSLLRGVIGLTLPYFILEPTQTAHIWAFALFMVGAMTDYWDGWLARQFNLESAFGRWVDPFVDKILILAPLAAFAKLKMFSIWWVVPLFAREIIVTFCRTGWLLEGKSIGAEKLGKLKFVFQTITVWISFACFVFVPYQALKPLTGLLWLSLPYLLGLTAFLTILSGIIFLVNQREHFFSHSFAKFVLAVGVGLLPKAPGTWGSLLGLLLVFLTRWNVWLYAGTAIFLFWAGTCFFPHLKDADPDPHYVVMDEVLGMFVTFMLIPWSWTAALSGFLLFRVFDVLKPFPVRLLERIPRYGGIVADDVGAGLYAWLVLFLVFK